MKISLITPNLNNGPLLEKAIESLMCQTHTDWEMIIVDGNSTDVSAHTAREYNLRYPGKIRLMATAPKGVYNALNNGITSAEGDIIGTLHGNDFLADNSVLSKVDAAFRTGNRIDVAYGDIYFINPYTGEKVREYIAEGFDMDILRCGIAPPHTGMFFNRDIFRRFGLYDPEFTNAADFEFIVRLASAGVRTARIPCFLEVMTTGGASTTLLNRIFRNPYEKINSLHKNNLTPDYSGFLSRLFSKLISTL